MRLEPMMVKRDDLDNMLRSAGPAKIRRRQATFWEIDQIGGPQRFRIEFRNKREFFADEALQGEVSLESSHPILRDYSEGRSSLLLESKVADPEVILHSLDELCSRQFRGWRSLDRYLNPQVAPELLLEQGYGLLLEGPSDFVRAAHELLSRSRIQTQIRPLANSPIETRVLMIGRSFVVADSFVVQATSQAA